MDWSIFTMVMVHGGVLVLGYCEWFRLCRYNLGGDEKGGVGVKFCGWLGNSSVIVRWRKMMPSSRITAA